MTCDIHDLKPIDTDPAQGRGTNPSNFGPVHPASIETARNAAALALRTLCIIAIRSKVDP